MLGGRVVAQEVEEGAPDEPNGAEHVEHGRPIPGRRDDLTRQRRAYHLAQQVACADEKFTVRALRKTVGAATVCCLVAVKSFYGSVSIQGPRAERLLPVIIGTPHPSA